MAPPRRSTPGVAAEAAADLPARVLGALGVLALLVVVAEVADRLSQVKLPDMAV